MNASPIGILAYPVEALEGGIKIKPELMEVDTLYHCVYENAVFIFFKDNEELMHCYQVEDPAVVRDIIKNPTNLEKILHEHAMEK